MVSLPDWAYSSARPAGTHSVVPIKLTCETSAYGRQALEAERERIANAPPHSANDTLNRASFSVGQLSAGGEIAEADAFASLYAAARERRIPEPEIIATVNSGFKAGCKQPRMAPDNGSREPATTAVNSGREPVNSLIRGAGGVPTSARPKIVATPYVWRDPKNIPRREWLYGRHLIRGYVSATVAPAGVGKSFLVQAEALAMATGRDIFGVKPDADRLRVWLWNLEDPAEEIERRLAAAMMHHGIEAEEIEGRLFISSGRDTPLVIARKIGEQVSVVEPMVDEIVVEIVEKKIDVLVIDPFVSSHDLPENDNMAMDKGVKAWARVADLGNCAVELVHHARKQNGESITADSARGGSAFAAAVRELRLLSRMDENEASRLGVHDPYRYFCQTTSGKQNMAPPPETRQWYRLASVSLPNGDNVGVVEAWTPPDPLDGVGPDHLREVQAKFRNGAFRENEQATDWGGVAVAEVLKLDIGHGSKASQRSPSQRAARAKVKSLLGTWLAEGKISTETRRDAKRSEKVFYSASKSNEGD